MRVRSSAWVFAAQVSKTALTIPVGILLARALGPGGKGSVAVAQTIVAVSVVVMNLGMPSAIMWLAAKGRATARSAAILGLVFGVGALAVLGATALVLGPARLITALGLDSAVLLAVAAVATVPSMLAHFLDAYLVGRGVIKQGQVADVVALGAQLLLIAGLAAAGVLTPEAAVLVWLTTALAATAWKAVLALRTLGPLDDGPMQVWRSGRAYGLKAWLGSTVNLLSLRQDVLLLGALSGTAEVGVYTISVAAAELAWYVPNALQGVATAKFSAEQDSVALAMRLNRAVWPFTLLFAGFVSLIAVPLIPLVYGQDFASAVTPMFLLMPGVVATSMSSSLAAWMNGRGFPEDVAFANVVNMGTNLVANIALTPRLGAEGAALASTISYTAASVLLLVRFRRRTGGSLAEMLVTSSADVRTMAGVFGDEIRRRIASREVD